MGVRFVKFGQTYVNPLRVLFVTDVYAVGEINMGTPAPVKTGIPTSRVIKMLEDAMGEQPDANGPGHGLSEVVRKAVLADVVQYLEGKLADKVKREA